MSFVPAFGSFGDFVAVLQLAAAIGTSLKEACSASAEINALALDIESFSLAIESARATIQRADTGHLPRSLDLALSHSLHTCSAILSKLQSKLKRMHALPGNRKWMHIQRAAWMWIALGGKADVETLKRRLVEQVTAVQTLVTVLQSSAMNDIAQRGERDSLKLDRMLGLLEDGPSIIQRELPFQFFDIHGRAVAPLAKFDLNAFIRFSRTLPNDCTYSAASPPEVGRLAQLLVMTHPNGQAGTGVNFHCTAACKIFAFQDPAAFGETIILVSPVFVYRHEEEVDDGKGTCDHTSPLCGEQLSVTSSHGLLTAIRLLKIAVELDTTRGLSASREQKLDTLTNNFALDLDDMAREHHSCSRSL
ncbi:hypothetical protein EXIGLDRAFT_764530 [Exidia glandulosa HHB12029]|uniref:Fungal N-terminal domain-containing protein n=1 Tax=Exidia glandulosa HHB12029 TaxID=1314781 RepID=A0A165L286_EXIGL|nr:hypothetical protein EXIGLDRAFT_764530 [Exidia glandulosa HHB12029]